MRGLIVVLAGVSGASGVATFAGAAHVSVAGSPEHYALSNAAIMLMVHGVGGLAILALSGAKALPVRWGLTALALVVGGLMFGGAVALPKFFGFGLFAMAAPIGGSLTILAWLMVALNGAWDASSR